MTAVPLVYLCPGAQLIFARWSAAHVVFARSIFLRFLVQALMFDCARASSKFGGTAIAARSAMMAMTNMTSITVNADVNADLIFLVFILEYGVMLFVVVSLNILGLCHRQNLKQGAGMVLKQDALFVKFNLAEVFSF